MFRDNNIPSAMPLVGQRQGHTSTFLPPCHMSCKSRLRHVLRFMVIWLHTLGLLFDEILPARCYMSEVTREAQANTGGELAVVCETRAFESVLETPPAASTVRDKDPWLKDESSLRRLYKPRYEYTIVHR